MAEKHPEMEHLVPIIKKAGRGSHSDDDLVMIDNVPTAKSRKLRWRGGRLSKAFYVCDGLNIEDKFDEEGFVQAGLFPRPRIVGEQESTRKPVKGLPRNCYDQEWLSGLDSDEREDLDVQDEEANLDIPRHLEAYDPFEPVLYLTAYAAYTGSTRTCKRRQTTRKG